MTQAGRKLPREFYLRDAREVARDLLGKELVRMSPEGIAAGTIVETEAYLGEADRASHAFGGRVTRRTAVLYEDVGRAYIYLIYGRYWCLNITAGAAGTPHCVLVRALEPREGVDLMRRRRGLAGTSLVPLANGPGKLCLALGIDGSLYGEDICGGTVFVREEAVPPPVKIGSSPRINIDYAGEDSLRNWRYFIDGNSFVSRARTPRTLPAPDRL
ncbi:MAG TPA: DNA-3-methyladenine glycosylase [Geobacteraceae bacterium]